MFYVVTMAPPKPAMKEIKLRSGDVIGRDNIEKFLSFASKLYDHNEKPIAELTYTYENAIASLVTRMEARFVNLTPILQ